MNSNHLKKQSHSFYRPDIDGLRAVAIVPVVLFHAFPNKVTGGYVGVDIFFVISGFLISGIIFSEIKNNSFSIIHFYSKRIRRIFPALTFVLTFCLIFGWFGLLGDEYKHLGKYVAGGIGFIANLLLWREVGYFDVAADSKPLLHLWSLGIEEQFYIIWPLALVFFSRRSLNSLTFTLILFLVSFLLNLILLRHYPTAVFFSPITRMWELLLGCILSALMFKPVPWLLQLEKTLDKFLDPIIYSRISGDEDRSLGNVRNLASILGILLIIYAIFGLKKNSSFPGWNALIPSFGAFLLIFSGQHAIVNKQLFCRRVMIWIGLISFPLYLWHWPILVFLKTMVSDEPSRNLRIGAVLLSVGFSWLTYQFIEKPIRFGILRSLKARYLFAFGIVVGLIGALIYKEDGFPARHSSFEKQWNTFAVPIWNTDICHKNYPWMQNTEWSICMMAKDTHPTIMIDGDSHGHNLYFGLADALQNTDENLLLLGKGGCIPFLDVGWRQKECRNLSLEIRDKVLRQSPSIKTVILAGWWNQYLQHFKDENAKLIDPRPEDTNNLDVNTSESVFQVTLKRTLDELRKHNKEIIFVVDNPTMSFDPKNCINSRPLTFGLRAVQEPCAIPRAKYDKEYLSYMTIVKSVLQDYPEVRIFDATDMFCDAQYCWAMRNDIIYFRDNNHLSLEGSDIVGASLKKFIFEKGS